MTPRSGNRIGWAAEVGAVWAADNDCFGGLHLGRWERFLRKVEASPTPPLWVACPDKLGDAVGTLAMFDTWEPVLRDMGVPVAFVGQDGLTAEAVPWDRMACLFVGGSTAWKLGDAAAELCREAKARGKLVHAGRVNSLRRIRYFARLGADTFDGSGWSSWGEARMPLAIRWVDAALADRQTVLFGGNA